MTSGAIPMLSAVVFTTVAMLLPSGQPLPSTDRENLKLLEAKFTPEQKAFWSFQPLKDRPPPEVHDSGWATSAIDRFLLAKLEEKGLKPNAPAGRRALLRRVTFDLIGLPPTPAEVDAFLNDVAPDAFEKVVDRLLASPHY